MKDVGQMAREGQILEDLRDLDLRATFERESKAGLEVYFLIEWIDQRILVIDDLYDLTDPFWKNYKNILEKNASYASQRLGMFLNPPDVNKEAEKSLRRLSRDLTKLVATAS